MHDCRCQCKQASCCSYGLVTVPIKGSSETYSLLLAPAHLHRTLLEPSDGCTAPTGTLQLPAPMQVTCWFKLVALLHWLMLPTACQLPLPGQQHWGLCWCSAVMTTTGGLLWQQVSRAVAAVVPAVYTLKDLVYMSPESVFAVCYMTASLLGGSATRDGSATMVLMRSNLLLAFCACVSIHCLMLSTVRCCWSVSACWLIRLTNSQGVCCKSSGQPSNH